MIVLDTNVVSETMRPRPNARVVAWLDEQPLHDVHLCTPVLAELRYGIARLADTDRKQDLERLCGDMVGKIFDGRVLSFDAAAADVYGALVAERETTGRPISVMDAMIAAIAVSNNAMLATRNVNDFDGTGVSLVNPFQP